MASPKKRHSGQPRVHPAWIRDSVDVEPVVLSTRVRLARNLRDYPFPHAASPEQLEIIAQTICQSVVGSGSDGSQWYLPVDVSQLSDSEKAALVDSHLVSLAHVVSGPHRIALLNQQHSSSILINEEDHIRIQTILPGLQPDEARHEANRIDNTISANLVLAYDAAIGYQTASLANVGTGMRMSVMLHLPALAFVGTLNKALDAIRALYSTVRGPYGEDGSSYGFVYQVSNSSSLGYPERGIAGRLTASATFLQTEESMARHYLRTRRQGDIEDLVSMTLDKLDNAKALTAEEAMQILSDLRLGDSIGVKSHVTHRMFCEMIASMRVSVDSIATAKVRARDVFYEDTRRPAIIRNRIRQEIADTGSNAATVH